MILPRNFAVLSGRCLALLLLLSLGACQTGSPLPRIDLTEPGWTIYRGQAVWRPDPHASGFAGDILVATNPDGRVFVQFSKTPLPLAVAQRSSSAWQVEFPLQHKRRAGRGEPPGRLIWFVLPAALSGTLPPPPWTWHRPDPQDWRLLNPKTGESLEGFFNS